MNLIGDIRSIFQKLAPNTLLSAAIQTIQSYERLDAAERHGYVKFLRDHPQDSLLIAVIRASKTDTLPPLSDVTSFTDSLSDPSNVNGIANYVSAYTGIKNLGLHLDRPTWTAISLLSLSKQVETETEEGRNDLLNILRVENEFPESIIVWESGSRRFRPNLNSVHLIRTYPNDIATVLNVIKHHGTRVSEDVVAQAVENRSGALSGGVL
jgi:hypothetical protein